MKRLLLTILIVLALATDGWGAVYYVSTAGSNTNPYDTPAKAALLPSTIIALNPAGGPHTVYIAPGDYTDAPYINHANWNSSVWQGVSAVGSVESAASGQVTWTGSAANYSLRVGTATGMIFNNITLQSAPIGKDNLYIGIAPVTFNSCIFQNSAQDGVRSSITSGTVNFSQCAFAGNARYSILASGAGIGASWIIDRCKFINNTFDLQNSVSTLMTVTSSIFSGTANVQLTAKYPTTVSNCTFEGGQNDDILIADNNAQTVNINNCIFEKTGNQTVGFYFVKNTSANAVVTVNNPIRSTQWSDRTWTQFNGTITVNSEVAFKGPLFQHVRRPGIIVVGIDDAVSYLHAQMVARIAEQYGYRITWAIESDGMNAAKWAVASNLNSRYHEIGNHSQTHTDLTTLGDAAIDAELAACNAAILANVGVAPTTIFYPGNAFNANVKARASAAGYLGARAGTAGTQYLMTSIGKYTVYGTTPGVFGLQSESPTEAQLRARIQSYCRYMDYNGGIGLVYGHDGSYDFDFTKSSWQIFWNEVSKSNCMVMTFRDAMAYLSSHAESTTGADGELAYVRTEIGLGDASDYRLAKGSPCIDAGIVVSGLSHDLRNREMPKNGKYDIGPYESWTIPAVRGARRINRTTLLEPTTGRVGRQGRDISHYLP